MKKLYSLAALFFLLNVFCKAQYVIIPDYDFRQFLYNKYPGCFSGAGLDTTCTEITTERSLIFNGSSAGNIIGIQYFDSLRYLDCSYNNLAEIGQLPPNLDTLIAKNEGSYFGGIPSDVYTPTLSALPALPSSLRYLDCSGNGLGGLPTLPLSLTWLDCSGNFQWLSYGPADRLLPTLGSIPGLPASLVHLNCRNNALSSLPTLPASLIYLNCGRNAFSYDYDHYDGTVTTYSSPGISSLSPLPSTLQFLNISWNPIILPVDLPGSLVDLTADNLDPATNLPPSLLYLECGGNNMYCLPHLPLSLGGHSPYHPGQYNLMLADPPYSYNASNVRCIPDVVPGLHIGRRFSDYGYWPASPGTAVPEEGTISSIGLTLPYCNILNNSHNCASSPSITGTVFYDNNSNGIQDPGELPREGVRVTLDNGQSGFSDINGLYVATGHIGNNTLTVDSPPFYNAVPGSFNYTLNSSDTVVNDLVALQPNTTADSMKITIVPWNVPRPGFTFSYDIKYENVGTTTVNPVIVISYENGNLSYLNSTNGAIISNGNSLTLTLNNISPGQKGEFTSNFTVTTNFLGIPITSIATATAGSSVCTSISSSVVQGSLDPNDKQAPPFITKEQVIAGGYIDYLVRFQNTGTDTAFNIIVTDKLSSLLQSNTFQVIEASHPCKIIQDNDNLSFEFHNVLLPDQNTNEPRSHGYVQFRVKPQTNLAMNTPVTNMASIYFDYNTPVLTSNVTTLVNVIVIPIKLSSFTVKKQNSSVQLYWTTEQETNSKEFIVERSTSGNKWDEITRVNAAGNSSQKINYNAIDPNPSKGINYYRLKQTDRDGQYTYSETRVVYFGSDGNVILIPNPARENVVVYMANNSSPATIQIFNLSGQLIKTVVSDKEFTNIDLTGISRGLYTMKIASKYRNEVKGLIVN